MHTFTNVRALLSLVVLVGSGLATGCATGVESEEPSPSPTGQPTLGKPEVAERAMPSPSTTYSPSHEFDADARLLAMTASFEARAANLQAAPVFAGHHPIALGDLVARSHPESRERMAAAMRDPEALFTLHHQLAGVESAIAHLPKESANDADRKVRMRTLREELAPLRAGLEWMSAFHGTDPLSIDGYRVYLYAAQLEANRLLLTHLVTPANELAQSAGQLMTHMTQVRAHVGELTMPLMKAATHRASVVSSCTPCPAIGGFCFIDESETSILPAEVECERAREGVVSQRTSEALTRYGLYLGAGMATAYGRVLPK